MIAAGVNAAALSSYLGHASVTITFDRYGHLMHGNEEQAAGLLDALPRCLGGVMTRGTEFTLGFVDPFEVGAENAPSE